MSATGLLTADEVARTLNCTQAQVLRLRRAGLLPAVNISAGLKPNYRWRPSALSAFLRNRKA